MRILLVEDNIRLGEATKEGLRQEGFAVDLVHTFDDGIAYGETEEYDLIILDRMLPGGKDGMDICAALRDAGLKAPILMLTARGELSDKVTGLKKGADDYLVKPFDLDELLARVEALTRRPHHYQPPSMNIGPLTINVAEKTVIKNGQQMNLTKREYALLQHLIRHKGEVVSKDSLIAHAWDFDANILPNTVEVFILNLRKKLDSPGEPSIIETVRGFGYKLRGSA